jgi:hypothetical protein
MRRLKKAFDLIDDDLASYLDPSVLVAASNMSEAYFCRLFKRLAGMSSTELHQQQTDRAREAPPGEGGPRRRSGGLRCGLQRLRLLQPSLQAPDRYVSRGI